MHLKSILNHVHPLKSFVYKRARLVKAAGRPAKIEVEIEPRANGRPICSGCGEKRPGYDRLTVRRFQFVPLWGMPVFLVYAMRRVKCPPCGVTVEQVPWATGKCRLTTSFRWFLAGWLGQAALVAGDGRCVPDNVGGRVSLGKTCGGMGARPP